MNVLLRPFRNFWKRRAWLIASRQAEAYRDTLTPFDSSLQEFRNILATNPPPPYLIITFDFEKPYNFFVQCLHLIR